MSDDVSRRRVLGTTGAALAASFGGCTSVLDGSDTDESSEPESEQTPTTTGDPTGETTEAAGNETTDSTTEDGDDGSFDTDAVEVGRPDVSFVDAAPVPDDPGRYDYATMAAGDPSATATVYGNWKCPYTREFVLTGVDSVVAEFVEPGALALEFRFMGYRSGDPFLGADAPRAARAGLAVWDRDPAGYWEYLARVFENQPQERYEWAQPDLLTRFAEAADVRNATGIRAELDGDAYGHRVQATTDAATAAGVYTVPRVVAAGEVTAPTLNPDATRAQLERAADR